MCLMPAGAMSILLPPSDTAKKWGTAMAVVLALHFAFIITLMVGLRWLDGIVDLIGLLIGYMAIRNREGYNVQQTLCYCTFCGLDLFWGVIKLILYYSGGAAVKANIPQWQFNVYVSTLISAPVVYTAGIAVSYQLYKELKNMIHEVTENLGVPGGMPSGTGPGGYMPVSQHESPERFGNRPTAGGFKAFSGEGHKLV
mmetsp:Transcript_50753/g.99458  ORF Transcript_50753/g.99458 Transcript_50753/m.99458 type:complete len:198 (-) Transcript_50753:402-995(-)